MVSASVSVGTVSFKIDEAETIFYDLTANFKFMIRVQVIVRFHRNFFF